MAYCNNVSTNFWGVLLFSRSASNYTQFCLAGFALPVLWRGESDAELHARTHTLLQIGNIKWGNPETHFIWKTEVKTAGARTPDRVSWCYCWNSPTAEEREIRKLKLLMLKCKWWINAGWCSSVHSIWLILSSLMWLRAKASSLWENAAHRPPSQVRVHIFLPKQRRILSRRRHPSYLRNYASTPLYFKGNSAYFNVKKKRKGRRSLQGFWHWSM